MFMLPLFTLLRWMAKLTPFLPPYFPPPEISLFWGTLIAITPLGFKRYFRPPWRGSIRLGHLFRPPPPPQWPWHDYSSPLLLLWYLLCSLLHRPILLLGDASGPGFWPPTNSSICPSLSGPLPQRASPILQFSESSLGWLWFYFDSHRPSAEEYWSFSLSSAATLFPSLTLNAPKSSISFGRIKRHLKAWWSAELNKAISERRKVFAAARKSDDRPSGLHLRFPTCFVCHRQGQGCGMVDNLLFSLSPKSNPKSVYSFLRSVAGSSSSSPNFPNCSSPSESTSEFADYLKSHFSVSQPKALRSRTKGYFSKLRRATCPEESYWCFWSPFSHSEFHAAASNLFLSTAAFPDKVAFPMLKHLPRSGMNFLLHMFNFSQTFHSFSSIWKTSSIIPIHKMGKPLDSPASFQHKSLTSCVLKLFERIILSRLLFFLDLIPFSLPARRVSALDGLL